MPRLHDVLSPARRLALAVRLRRPATLARTFASYAGQFHDREAFDELARQVSDLYAVDNPEDAIYFRSRLDRRLYDRYHAPVAWEVPASTPPERVA